MHLANAYPIAHPEDSVVLQRVGDLVPRKEHLWVTVELPARQGVSCHAKAARYFSMPPGAHRVTVLPTVWSSRSILKVAAFLTLVSGVTVTLQCRRGETLQGLHKHEPRGALVDAIRQHKPLEAVWRVHAGAPNGVARCRRPG